jgi:hypothetical protein
LLDGQVIYVQGFALDPLGPDGLVATGGVAATLYAG